MNRIALAAAVAALAAAGCARQPAPPPPSPPGAHKPSAPVSISAQLSGGSAHVTVRFEADAKDVSVVVHGVGGLAVTSAGSPVDGASFARGETAAFDVAFTPGAGRSTLAVGVSARFHGAGRRSAVASFDVGEPTKEQLEASGTVVETSEGERLKVVVPSK